MFGRTTGHVLLIGILAAGVAACSNSGDMDTSDPDPSPPFANNPPEITSGSAAQTPENQVDTGYTATATDIDGDDIAFSISGGADGELFIIDRISGELFFLDPPDFEQPADADGDNVYEVEIQASDGSDTDTVVVTITVSDVDATFSVMRVGTGFEQPIFLTGRGDDRGRVFVVERIGKIELLEPRTGLTADAPFLDIRGETTTDSERGLLGFALAPDFETSGVFYLNLTNLDGDTEIRRYTTMPDNLDRADPTSGDVILRIGQPAANHNGGWIGFGPDGYLYIATGDGGGSPMGRAQDRDNLLGKMLRIDPSADDFPGDDERDYAIPADNPFAGGGGAPEVWALGLRNPFRASFDRLTGDLWIGDVGQNRKEEVDLIPAGTGGLNFGWSQREGTIAFNGPPDPAFTDPVLEYDHGAGPFQGNSITGGIVYRGPLREFNGLYVYGDFISGNLWTVAVDELEQGATLDGDQATQRNDDFRADLGTIDSIAAFGEAANGDLFFVDLGGEIFELTGEVVAN